MVRFLIYTYRTNIIYHVQSFCVGQYMAMLRDQISYFADNLSAREAF